MNLGKMSNTLAYHELKKSLSALSEIVKGKMLKSSINLNKSCFNGKTKILSMSNSIKLFSPLFVISCIKLDLWTLCGATDDPETGKPN
jgi:hypothetical protein